MISTTWNTRPPAHADGVGADRPFARRRGPQRAGLLERCVALGAIGATVLAVGLVGLVGLDARSVTVAVTGVFSAPVGRMQDPGR